MNEITRRTALGALVAGAVAVASTRSSPARFNVTKLRVAINDGFWNVWAGGLHTRDIAKSSELFLGPVSSGNGYHDSGTLLYNEDFDSYGHWNETYDPARQYGAGPGDQYAVCVKDGVQWAAKGPVIGVTPNDTNTANWRRAGFAKGTTVLALDVLNRPTQAPSTPNTGYGFALPRKYKTSRYPVSINGTKPSGWTVSLSGSGGETTLTGQTSTTFTLRVTGDETGNPSIKFSRGSGTLSWTAIPSYETGSALHSVDKLADVTPFYGVRNMTGSGINRPPTKKRTLTTATRTTAKALIWQNAEPVWEYEVGLANALNKNARVQVPDDATDDYIDGMAAYYLANLNSNLAVEVALGNEMWNDGFKQARDLQDRTNAYNTANNPGISRPEKYAKELKAVIDRWRTVWTGQTARVEGVLEWQSVASLSDWQDMLNQDSLYSVARYVSIAPYFEGGIGGDPYNLGIKGVTPPNIIDALTANNYATFKTLCVAHCTSAIDQSVGYCKALYDWLPTYCVSKSLAAGAIGIDYYEGGQHIVVNGWTAGTEADQANTFFSDFRASAEMGDLYDYYLAELSENAPGKIYLFDYTGERPGNKYQFGAMEKVGNITEEPMASIRAAAATYNA